MARHAAPGGQIDGGAGPERFDIRRRDPESAGRFGTSRKGEEMLVEDKRKVVIIGAGAAGVFTAYLLQKNAPDRFDITILEKNDRVGGHTLSYPIELQDGQTIAIDGGAQFFSESTQPEYCAMLRDEGLFGEPGLIVECDLGVTIWSATRKELLFRVPRRLSQIPGSLLRSPVDGLNFGILTREAIRLFEGDDWGETFGEWIDRLPFGISRRQREAFVRDVARPFMYQFGLVHPKRLDELSAKFVVYYFVGSLSWNRGAPLQTYATTIGLDSVLTRLLEKYDLRVDVGSAVQAITREGDGYRVQVARGATYPADEIVFAINPPRIEPLLLANEPAYDAVRQVLRGMEYVEVPVVVQHGSPSYMPEDRRAWSEANILVAEDPVTREPTNYMFTVWFGPVLGHAAGAKFFKSWGSPSLVPQDAPRHTEQIHELMVGTPDFLRRRRELRRRHQGRHNLWYTGGYILDYDTQNACLKAASDVAAVVLRTDEQARDRAAA